MDDLEEIRTFDHFPEQDTCPMCGKNDDKKCILVQILGTGDGRICEAMPIHLRCLAEPKNYAIMREEKIIFARLK